MYTFSFIVGPKSVKCIHSATKAVRKARVSSEWQGDDRAFLANARGQNAAQDLAKAGVQRGCSGFKASTGNPNIPHVGCIYIYNIYNIYIFIFIFIYL